MTSAGLAGHGGPYTFEDSVFQWDILGRPLTLLALQTCAYAVLAVTMDRSQRTGHPCLGDAAGPLQRALQSYLEPLLPRLPLAMQRHASRWLGLKAVQGSLLLSQMPQHPDTVLNETQDTPAVVGVNMFPQASHAAAEAHL